MAFVVWQCCKNDSAKVGNEVDGSSRMNSELVHVFFDFSQKLEHNRKSIAKAFTQQARVLPHEEKKRRKKSGNNQLQYKRARADILYAPVYHGPQMRGRQKTSSFTTEDNVLIDLFLRRGKRKKLCVFR